MSIDLDLKAVSTADGWRLAGGVPLVGAANGYLTHLCSRAFSPATVRAYAFDIESLEGHLRRLENLA